ncbi:MAG TPA: ATP-binding cassette domain-containing protein [Casimicrobiaceae bacterium]
MAAILITEALTRRFGALAAVDSLDLAIDEGEVFGLLGRNGAGKTTLIKMLTTLLPPSSGRARVGGFDIASESSRVRSIIGYVPQALSADGELTGRENLLIFARLYDIPRRLTAERIAEGLAFMDLTAAADKLVSTYSGGMIRRLEIAQSMLHRPRVLFLDEPTVGLDPVAREAVWEHLRQLRTRYGTTIVLTSHYMDEVEQLCDRVAILRHGRAVATGTLAELRAKSGNPTGNLDQIFAFYTEDSIADLGGYRETANARTAARRLG